MLYLDMNGRFDIRCPMHLAECRIYDAVTMLLRKCTMLEVGRHCIQVSIQSGKLWRNRFVIVYLCCEICISAVSTENRDAFSVLCQLIQWFLPQMLTWTCSVVSSLFPNENPSFPGIRIRPTFLPHFPKLLKLSSVSALTTLTFWLLQCLGLGLAVLWFCIFTVSF